MPERLRAVVVGAGWAGEGHTKALQWCGVEVAAICARQTGVVRAVADRLGVAEASTDWRESIARLRPDIVTLATPAALREPVVAAAVGVGAHVLCEKPLAVDGAAAERLYRLVADAGVRHAYAAVQGYGPSVRWLAELVRDGAVGRLEEIVFTLRLSLAGQRPWGWALSLEHGGGMLNNSFTHLVTIFAEVTGGTLARTVGTARDQVRSLPVVPDLHDFRHWIGMAVSAEAAAGLERRAADADTGFDALLEYATPRGEVTIAVAHGGAGVATPGEANGMRLHGDAGTLIAAGWLDYAVSRAAADGGAPEPLPVPERLIDELPRVADDMQNKWCALARDFVAAVRGEPHRPYPTFRDGWRTHVAIDAIRGGTGWTVLPA